MEEVIGKNPSILQSGIHDALFYNRNVEKFNKMDIWQK